MWSQCLSFLPKLKHVWASLECTTSWCFNLESFGNCFKHAMHLWVFGEGFFFLLIICKLWLHYHFTELFITKFAHDFFISYVNILFFVNSIHCTFSMVFWPPRLCLELFITIFAKAVVFLLFTHMKKEYNPNTNFSQTSERYSSMKKVLNS